MSIRRRTRPGARGARPSGPSSRALVDDAAMFPPGQRRRCPGAVAEHLARRPSAWYADLVGPLLVPADRGGGAARRAARPSRWTSAWSPGRASPLDRARATAVDRLAAGRRACAVVGGRARLVADRAGTSRDGLGPAGRPVEVRPRAPTRRVALEDVRERAAGESPLRPSCAPVAPTDGVPVPDGAELATFLRTLCRRRTSASSSPRPAPRRRATTTADGRGPARRPQRARAPPAGRSPTPRRCRSWWPLLSERDPAPLVDDPHRHERRRRQRRARASSRRSAAAGSPTRSTTCRRSGC